jgi:thymidylate synthase (FAD)
MSVQHVSTTPDSEKTMAYIARVSNPANQHNTNVDKLLKFCIKNEHWSVFEHAHMTLEIVTSRAIAAQLLRHRSFTFQEFSQRYAKVTAQDSDLIPEFRRKHPTNRQSSIDDLDTHLVDGFKAEALELARKSLDLYNRMLDQDVAPETARFVLPLTTPTKVYMTGNCRSWVHYIQLRGGNGTQLEHQRIADECKTLFSQQFPTVAKALDWVPAVPSV